MKRTIGIIVMISLMTVTGFVGYRIGLRRTPKWTKPLKAYIGGDEGALIEADQIVIELDDGKKVTVDLQRTGGKFVSVHAGLPWPDGQDDPNWYTLIIMPSAANLIRLSVDAHPKMTPKEKETMERKGDALIKEIEDAMNQTNNASEDIGAIAPNPQR